MNVDDAAMNNATETSVTVIGLGLMGQALVGAFLAAGHPTTVLESDARQGRPTGRRGCAACADHR